MASSDKHEKRLQRWQSRVPEKTRLLSELLIRKLVPIVEAAGFAKVDRELARPERPVEGSELRFERESGGRIDVVYAFFDKYSSPRFQIGFSRRDVADRDVMLRSGHLVKQSSEYYHEWGKPRWLPLALWSESQARASVDEVVENLPQVFRFLESGERGPRISRSVDRNPPASGNGG
ncbi:MAG: hypothetical protein NDI84_10650 [Steroidobacteraceae bacterium]|nr:hypothetical protein [Steroidobacteraceae bacterium]